MGHNAFTSAASDFGMELKTGLANGIGYAGGQAAFTSAASAIGKGLLKAALVDTK